MAIELFQRDVTKSEIDRVTEGFREHGREQGVPDVDQVRISIAAMDGDSLWAAPVANPITIGFSLITCGWTQSIAGGGLAPTF